MKALIACEMSGRVRDAFRAFGHDAYSCDILPSLGDSTYHLQGDVTEILRAGWDLMVAFPPCTHLSVSGARWWPEKIADGRQQEALSFVHLLMNAPIDNIAIENPVGKISTSIRKPDQIIQPWQFGHGETKATCLWLKNLPLLVPTNIVEGREHRIARLPPTEDRAMLRSLTYQGVADAMAEQWGG
jgi:site-specific DNA-cytosine methylase